MSNEQATPDRDTMSADQPRQGDWPGTGPAPTERERENVGEQIAEGKWSESRQRADWTGVNHADLPASGSQEGQNQAREQGMSNVEDQVKDGAEAPG